jgi:hypothetical protein
MSCVQKVADRTDERRVQLAKMRIRRGVQLRAECRRVLRAEAEFRKLEL